MKRRIEKRTHKSESQKLKTQKLKTENHCPTCNNIITDQLNPCETCFVECHKCNDNVVRVGCSYYCHVCG